MTTPKLVDPGTDHPQPHKPVPQLFAQLTADARAFAHAEIALLKARGQVWAGGLKAAAILIGAAIAFAMVATVALGAGLVLALATLVGPLGATGIVVASFLALAGLCGWLGARRISRTSQDASL